MSPRAPPADTPGAALCRPAGAAPTFVLPNWVSAPPVRRVTGTKPLQLPPIDLVVPRLLGSLITTASAPQQVAHSSAVHRLLARRSRPVIGKTSPPYRDSSTAGGSGNSRRVRIAVQRVVAFVSGLRMISSRILIISSRSNFRPPSLSGGVFFTQRQSAVVQTRDRSL